MNEVRIVKSDREQITELIATLIGLAVLAYTSNPGLFERGWERVCAWAYAWNHRVSVWEAINAIRSLPETGE